MKRLLLIAAAVALWLSPARADLTIRISSGQPAAKVRDHASMYATADQLAMVWQPGADAKRGSHIIFHAGRQTMWIIDDADKSYLAMDKATVDQMGQQMNEAMTRMKAVLDQMPPEQRKMMEKQMGQMMGAGDGKPSELKITRAAESRTVSGLPCTRYDAALDGTVNSHLWVTPYERAKLRKEDMAVFVKMADFFKSMTSQFSKYMKAQDNPFMASDQIDGVPILTQQVDRDGKVTQETLIETISHDAAPPGVFEVPKGYKQKDLPKPAKAGD